MKFPNAYKGVKKIWIAELIMILVAVVGIVTVVIPAANGVDINDEVALSNAPFKGLLAALAIVAALGALVAFFFNLIGIIGARKDDTNFKIALYVTLLGIAASIVSAIWSNSKVLNKWMDIVITLSSLFASYYVLTGIASLAEKYPDEETKAFVLKSRTWLEGSFCLTIVLKFIANIFHIQSEVALLIMGIAALVVEIISYVLYLCALNKGKNMLAK